MVLCISQKSDTTVDFLYEQLSMVRRKKFIRLNTEDFPAKVRIALGASQQIVSISGLQYSLSHFSSAWYRRPGRPIIPLEVMVPDVRKYAEEECWQNLLGLWEMSKHLLWVSDPVAIRRAQYKAGQLPVAESLGFTCPRTLITNDPQAARDFLESIGGEGIVKTSARANFQVDGRWKMVYTNRISATDPRLEDVVFAPCIFQEYIPKDIELRVTVVGRKVLACAIGSQVSAKTKDDWRRYDPKVTPYYPFSLPKVVEEQCLRIVAHYGLQFGAIDLILTPAGKYVFLEINPNGQWEWIETSSGLPIAQTLADLLYSRENCT